jgi:hypothetical protein
VSPSKYCKLEYGNVQVFYWQTSLVDFEYRMLSSPAHQQNVHNIMNGHGQIDWVEFQKMPDGNYKYLVKYIDFGRKLRLPN